MGRSISSTPPAPRATVRIPLRVVNWTDVRWGATSFSSTKPEASVAWPHRSTSTVGVNQRRCSGSAFVPAPTSMKAVSDRLFSAAISCIRSVASGAWTRQMAAGFPANGRSAKAST